MGVIDTSIVIWLNQWMNLSWVLDKAIYIIANNNLIKGGVFATLFMALWHTPGDWQTRNREHIAATFITVIPAIATARLWAILAPMRLRPMHEPNLGFVMPEGSGGLMLDGMNSFPSDHAVLYMTMVVGFFYLSRRIGWVMTSYTVIVILMPRLYLGYHYLSDILAGALLGLLFGFIGNNRFIIKKLARPVMKFEGAHPQVFYAGFFLLTYQIADQFNSSRAIVISFLRLVFRILHIEGGM